MVPQPSAVHAIRRRNNVKLSVHNFFKRSPPRGGLFLLLFFGKVFKGILRKYKNFTREHGQTITQVPKKYFAQLRGRIKAL